MKTFVSMWSFQRVNWIHNWLARILIDFYCFFLGNFFVYFQFLQEYVFISDSDHLGKILKFCITLSSSHVSHLGQWASQVQNLLFCGRGLMFILSVSWRKMTVASIQEKSNSTANLCFMSPVPLCL